MQARCILRRSVHLSLVRRSLWMGVVLLSHWQTVASELVARPQLQGDGRWAYILPGSLHRDVPRWRSFDTLAIVGFYLEADGSLHDPLGPRSGSSAALRSGVVSGRTLYPVIAFRNGTAGRSFLQSRVARQRATLALRRLAAAPFSGIHLDFEGPGEAESQLFAEFLKTLHSILQQDKKTLTIALFPPNFPASPSLSQGAFHKPELLSPHADGFILMTYDLHRPSSSPGPVTDLRWAAEGIRLSRQHIPAEKIWLGVPAYGYEWTLPGRRYRTLTAPLFQQLLHEKNAEIRRDPSGCLFVARRTPDQGTTRLAWFPDQDLRNRFESLAKTEGLRGTALWRPEFDGKDSP